jgi:hypothetical protein
MGISGGGEERNLFVLCAAYVVQKIGTHDTKGRHQQVIAPGGIGRQKSYTPIQADEHIDRHVPEGLSDLILLSVIHIEIQ